MADKIEAKNFISGALGTTLYNVPLLGKWSRFDEINFDNLPKSFVLKCNHDSYSWIIVRDKDNFDKASAKNKLETALARDYYHTVNKQWAYKDIKPYILAEYFLDDPDKKEYQI